MSFTEMKSVPIFYLHCTCYKFRIAVLIFDRINVIRAKSLEDISRRSDFIIWRKQYQLIQRDLSSVYISLYFSLIGGAFSLPGTNTRLFGQDVTSFHTALLHFFNVRKSLPSRVNFYLINLLSKRWCQKSLSKTMQHVGLLLIGFSLPRIR